MLTVLVAANGEPLTLLRIRNLTGDATHANYEVRVHPEGDDLYSTAEVADFDRSRGALALVGEAIKAVLA